MDITTKPGVNSWHGSFNFGFRDESLNGRQAFATFRGPEQQRRFGLSLDGPLWKNHTSLFLNADGSLFFDAKTIVATLPSGNFTDLAYRPSRRLNLDARIEQAVNKTHTARFQFQRNAVLQNNLGVGDFDLAARGYSQDQTEYIARCRLRGVRQKFFNEIRLQTRWTSLASKSVTLSRTVLVPVHLMMGVPRDSAVEINSTSNSQTMSTTHSRNTEFDLEYNSKAGITGATIQPTRWALSNLQVSPRINSGCPLNTLSESAILLLLILNTRQVGTSRTTTA